MEVAEAVEYLSQSTDVSVLVNDARVDYVSKGIIGHDNRGLWSLPKFKYLNHIRLCGDQFYVEANMHGSTCT